MNNTSFLKDRILVIASNLGTYPNFFIFNLKNGKDITFKTSFFCLFFFVVSKKKTPICEILLKTKNKHS
jgi:hypothetical protein